MTAAPYTPETINRIREGARRCEAPEAVAREIGWSMMRLERTCQQHGIIFDETAGLFADLSITRVVHRPAAKPAKPPKRVAGDDQGSKRVRVVIDLDKDQFDRMYRSAYAVGLHIDDRLRDFIDKCLDEEDLARMII